MHNITLICTVHKIVGKCTPDELYKIIQKINPEVIFEEIDFSRRNDYYRNQYVKTIETLVIVKYLQNHICEHIPVETYDVPDLYIKNEDFLNGKFVSNNIYNALWKKIFDGINETGFSFLNSNECSDIFEKINNLKENYINNLNDENVNDIYKSWLTVENNRENEMLKNIYNYSMKNNYNSALFITGARHRKSFINKIDEYEINNKIKLGWKFNMHNS
jgi:DNA-binding protein Fis